MFACKRALFLFLAVIICPPLYSQSFLVSGTVSDELRKSPVSGAEIFLANTMMGTSTDAFGRFTIAHVPAGRFDIVITKFGFAPIVQEIELIPGKAPILFFNLRAQSLPAESSLSFGQDGWQENFNSFANALLGRTQNAQLVKIKNPETLVFAKNEAGALLAFGREPLIITNRALGYELRYVLIHFSAQGDNVRIDGKTRFSTLDHGTAEEIAVWHKNRDSAYRGSLRHFLTELVRYAKSIPEVTVAQLMEHYAKLGKENGRFFQFSNHFNHMLEIGRYKEETRFFDLADTLSTLNFVRNSLSPIATLQAMSASTLFEQSGFKITQSSEMPQKNKRVIAENVNITHIVQAGKIPGEYRLKSPDYFTVSYLNETPEKNYLDEFGLKGKPAMQTSVLKLEAPVVRFDEHGRYWDTFKLHTYGYWAWERLAESLPYEYEPVEAN